MKDRKKNPIERVTDIPNVKVSGSGLSSVHEQQDFKKVDVPNVPKPKPKKKTMLKRILASKIFKGITSVIGGAIGLGGSVFAGLDPEFAVLVAATAVIAIFMGLDKAAKFKEIFDEDLQDNAK